MRWPPPQTPCGQAVSSPSTSATSATASCGETSRTRAGSPTTGRSSRASASRGPNLFVREIAAFLRNDDGTWRRDDERHENVLVDTAAVPALLAEHGVQARVAESFGDEELPDGLVAIVGRKADG